MPPTGASGIAATFRHFVDTQHLVVAVLRWTMLWNRPESEMHSTHRPNPSKNLDGSIDRGMGRVKRGIDVIPPSRYWGLQA